MIARSTIIALAFAVIAGCGTTDPYVPTTHRVLLQPQLERDARGYYLLTMLRDRFQTVQRIRGTVTRDDGQPLSQEQKIWWESSHTWTFVRGDTIMKIIRRNVNDQGYWVNVDTSIIQAPMDMTVPTVNPTSYTRLDGEVNTMIGPVLPMLGDTMTIVARWYDPWYSSDTTSDVVHIILR
jgi:hypothetical protein